jgi:hypothetical protein
MSGARPRAVGYVVAVVLCIPLAVLAYFVAGYVGWLGVVVGLGVTGMAALVARRARRLPERAGAGVQSTSAPRMRPADGRIDAEATAAEVDAAMARSSLAYRLNRRGRRMNRETIAATVRDRD